MRENPSFFKLSTLALAVSAGLYTAPAVYAQDPAIERVEEVVVTGSRRAPRTALDSAVPIDVFSANDFQNQGTGDMQELLRNLVPSYSVATQTINDTASLVRPARLRGLPADNTLIMVNSKRRHRSAAIVFNDAGTHFPDVSQIIPLALKQVEVLRDGAGAQYGSDAIAGVINFILNENREGFTLEVKAGQYTEGSDGDLTTITGNIGLPLGDDGFFSFTFETTQQDPTDRGIQRRDAIELIDRGNTAVVTPVMTRGIADQETINLFYNTGFDLSSTQRVYSHGSYSEKESDLGFFFRNPENTNGIFSFGGNQLFFDLSSAEGPFADDGIGCPIIPTGAATRPDGSVTTSSVLAREASLADPNCYSFTEDFPGGFTPVFGAGIVDMATVVGISGEFANGTFYDVSMNLGRSELNYRLTNTVNASLGPDTPNEFSPGSYITTENNLNFDFVTPIEFGGFYSPLSIGYGAEWRREIFETTNRDELSYLAGPYANAPGAPGLRAASGFPGFDPSQQGEWSRSNWAFYVDLEADVTERLLVAVAVRFEDYYDTFGTTLDGKVALRYALTDNMNLRGSVGTGFRAPSPGTENVTFIATGINPVTSSPQSTAAAYSVNNLLARAAGAVPLTPEESVSYTFGITATIAGRVDVSLDYYNIEVTDRISRGSSHQVLDWGVDQVFGPNPTTGINDDEPGAIELIRQEFGDTVAGQAALIAGDVVAFRFFSNNIDSTTQGVDLVATWDVDWGDIGRTSFQTSVSWLDTKADKFPEGHFTRGGLINFEERLPDIRGGFRINHRLGDLRFSLNTTYYGEYPAVPSSSTPSRDYTRDDVFILSGEVAYTWNDRYTLVVGADNLTNKLPDRAKDFFDCSGTCPTFRSSNPRSTAGAYGINGAFWYTRLRVEL